jgi:hypothetical protein
LKSKYITIDLLIIDLAVYFEKMRELKYSQPEIYKKFP